MNRLKNSIFNATSVSDLSNETLQILKQKIELKFFKKKEIFIKAGEFQNQFFFLTSGIARAYITDENGKEFTRSLFRAPAPMTSIKAFVNNSKSEICFDCLTDCEMYIGNFNDFIHLTKTNIEISNMYSRMLEKGFLKVEERVFELSMPAKERYESLRKRIPNIDNLIPQYQIASYLGITPVQLSRIRNQ